MKRINEFGQGGGDEDGAADKKGEGKVEKDTAAEALKASGAHVAGSGGASKRR